METQRQLTRSYFQGQGSIFPLGRTLGEYLESAAREVPDKVSIIYRDRKLTYSQLNAAVDQVARGLYHLGYRRGDRLAICLPDWPEYTIMYYACAKLGVVTSPVSPRYREREFINILGHAGSKGVIVPSEWQSFDFIGMLDRIRPQLPSLQHIFVMGDHAASNRPDVHSYDLLARQDWFVTYPANFFADSYYQQYPLDGDTLLEIAYTSGTTGMPKGVMQAHNNRAAVGLLNNEAWGAKESDVMVAMAPLCHSTGSNHSQNAAILGRFAIVYLEAWEPEVCFEAVEKNQATILIGVPAMYIQMMNHPRRKDYDLSSLRGLWCAGSPVPLEVARGFTTAFGATFFHCYGTTECGGNHNTRYDDPVEVSCGSVGPPIRNMECKIIDESGDTVPIGVAGEVCARGPARFLGYYNNPEATAAAIDPAGWFHSGDLGTMDHDGYVRIIGRKKDMIIRGGLNIYASEIEEILYDHPAVAQAYLVGYPDDRLGERTCAFVQLHDPDGTLTRDDLVAFMSGKVAKHKIPDRVEVVTSFPLTPSGKVQKFKLQELAAAAGSNATYGAGK